MKEKTTSKHAATTNKIDKWVREQKNFQLLTSDMVHVLGGLYLVSVAELLELMLTTPLNSRSAVYLGKSLISHMHLLESRVFTVNRVITDPKPRLVALQNKIQGVAIETVGAGDHFHKVDARIRRLKKIVRSVIASLPHTLLVSRKDDLVVYVTSRKKTLEK